MSAQAEDERIRSGLLRHVRLAAAGDRKLPGEHELAAAVGCSRPQLRQALADLERAQVLRRRQGAATTVDPVGLRLSVRLEDQFDHTSLLTRLGYTVDAQELGTEPVTLTEHVAGLLDVPVGSPAVRTLRRWNADGAPAMVAQDILLLPAGTTDLPTGSVFDAAAALWGESMVWEVATVTAAAVDPVTAAHLELPVGSAALVLEMVGLSASGRRTFYTLEHHRPDLVQYSVVRTVRPPWRTTDLAPGHPVRP